MREYLPEKAPLSKDLTEGREGASEDLGNKLSRQKSPP